MSIPAADSRAVATPALIRLYAGLLETLSPILERYLRRRLKAGKEDPDRFAERHGIAARPRPDCVLVWLHAASVGESMSMLRLVERISAERPNVGMLVTTGTVTSAEIVAARLGERAIHQFVPVDRKPWVERFLDHWRPDCAIWIESEIWPNLLLGVARRSIPAALVNGRMSARSFARWRLVPNVIRRLLATFDLCLAQTEDEAERLRHLGAGDVRFVGHLKYAAANLPYDAQQLAELKRITGTRPLWVLASSHPGEDEIAIASHRTLAARFPGLLTIIVPRHVQRGPAIADLARDAGLAVSLRSGGLPPAPRDSLYVADTMGELGLWYRLAPVACIGGSLVAIGGHNPIEAAQLGSALLFGPHMTSFAGVAAELIAAGAAETVTDAASLSDAIGRLFEDRAAAAAMGAAARRVAERNRQVLDRVLSALSPLLDRAAARHAAGHQSAAA